MRRLTTQAGRRYRRLRNGLLALPLVAASLPALAAPPVVPPPGATYRIQTRFHDWILSCARGCHALTRVTSQAPGAPEVLRLAVAPAGDGVYTLTFRTPAPLYLPEPLLFAPDRGEPLPVPWFTCDPRGCEARLTVGATVIEALRAGEEATVELALADGSRARLPLSLRGFTAALRAAAQPLSLRP